MVGRYFCPMLEVQCWGERCAWWDIEEENCAIIELLYANRQLSKELTEWRLALKEVLKS